MKLRDRILAELSRSDCPPGGVRGLVLWDVLEPGRDEPFFERWWFTIAVGPRINATCRELVAEGVLEEREEPGGPERGFRPRFYYALAGRMRR